MLHTERVLQHGCGYSLSLIHILNEESLILQDLIEKKLKKTFRKEALSVSYTHLNYYLVIKYSIEDCLPLGGKGTFPVVSDRLDEIHALVNYAEIVVIYLSLIHIWLRMA